MKNIKNFDEKDYQDTFEYIKSYINDAWNNKNYNNIINGCKNLAFLTEKYKKFNSLNNNKSKPSNKKQENKIDNSKKIENISSIFGDR
jgi:hypothetical protein